MNFKKLQIFGRRKTKEEFKNYKKNTFEEVHKGMKTNDVSFE